MSSSDIESPGTSLPIGFEEAENTSQELTGQPVFNTKIFLERQGTINEIVSRDYPSDENRVADLNSHISGWDDEDGINFTYLVGQNLPGLEVHVPATAIAFSANYAPGADFQGSNLDYSVLAASVLPDLRISRGSLDHALMPFAKIGGNAVGVSAVKSVMNFSDISKLDMRGVDVGAAYLLGTQGLDAEKLLSLADAQEAISELAQAEKDPELAALLGDSLSRFASADGEAIKSVLRRLRHPQVFSRVNAAEVILRKQLRDRRQGVVMSEVVMNGSEISKFDFEGSVWHKVMADRLHAVATRMAGSVLIRSSIDNADSRGLYAPGLVAIESSFRGTQLPENSAGSVFFDCDLTGSAVDEVEEGGTVIIGGKPPLIEEELPYIRILDYSQVPKPVLDNLIQRSQTSVKPRSIKPAAPELQS